MVEPPAQVSRLPIRAAVTPPTVRLLIFRNEMPRGIDPIASRDPIAHHCSLNLGMTDDIAQLLAAPHVMFTRRDIQIADQNARAVTLVPLTPIGQRLHEVQLMTELRVQFGVGYIPACRHIQIVNFDAAGMTRADIGGDLRGPSSDECRFPAAAGGRGSPRRYSFSAHAHADA